MRAIILAALLLSACATTGTQPEKPQAPPKEVKVIVSVPCPALEKLGDEPVYSDNDAALAAAPDLFEKTKLVLIGRLERIKRLNEYVAVKASCK